MPFLTANILIEADAAALNRGDKPISQGQSNGNSCKMLWKNGKRYPYVSAQAYRYWLRKTFEARSGMQSSPMIRDAKKSKQVYSSANPAQYWDDDMLGYMRVIAKEKGVEGKTLKRTSPLRVSTLISMCQANENDDFSANMRTGGDSAPFGDHFYTNTLTGTLSLDLGKVGVFKTVGAHKEMEPELAEEGGLTVTGAEDGAYALPDEARKERVNALMDSIIYLSGGANQTLHYSDVRPDAIIFAVLRGGNNIFSRAFQKEANAVAKIDIGLLAELLDAHSNELLSDVYIGVEAGYSVTPKEDHPLAPSIASIEDFANSRANVHYGLPVQMANKFAEDLDRNASWLTA